MEQDQLHQELFWTASRLGHLQDVKESFKEESVHIDRPDGNGVTALIHAARNGHAQIVRYLLVKKANVDDTDKDQWTALMHAASKGHKDVASLLLEYKLRYGNKRIIARIVCGRVIITACRKLHEDLDKLMNRFEVNIPGDHMEWKDRFKVNSETQRVLLKSIFDRDYLYKHELRDSEAQVEALTLMLFELNRRAGKYDTDELQLIKRIFHSVASFSKIGIPKVPSWFIPPHEVDFRSAIGAGGFGSVYLGFWDKSCVAVKSATFHEHEQTREMFLKEADIWSCLKHPHIVEFFGACHVGNPFFVCEYASNGNLFQYLHHPKTKHKTWKCLHEAAQGLIHLHKKKIVHLDLKCDNILICHDGGAKLTDFGLSCRVGDLPSSGNAQKVGAVRWKAHEYISGESSGSFACDVYSFGMTIIEAVTRRPYGEVPDAGLKHRAKKKMHKLPFHPEEMTESQWSLIKRMCSTNPDERIDIAVAVEELKAFAEEELANHQNESWGQLKLEQNKP